MRGTYGGGGTDDIVVDWEMHTGPYWFLYGGGYNSYLGSAPVLSCHHKDFLFFGATLDAAATVLPENTTFWLKSAVYSGSDEKITACAELRPTPAS